MSNEKFTDNYNSSDLGRMKNWGGMETPETVERDIAESMHRLELADAVSHDDFETALSNCARVPVDYEIGHPQSFIHDRVTNGKLLKGVEALKLLRSPGMQSKITREHINCFISSARHVNTEFGKLKPSTESVNKLLDYELGTIDALVLSSR